MSEHNRTLMTIGYQGASLDDFIATLLLAEVELLLDIRDLPISRKRGFSKTSLAKAVQENGIAYRHMKQLGDPKEGRTAARNGDHQRFERVFRAHLGHSESQAALDEVAGIASEARTCLLCFERDHSGCHRAIVASAVSEREPIEIRHIGVRIGIAKEQTGHTETTHHSAALR